MDNIETDIINHYKASLSRSFISAKLDHEKIELLLEENKKLKKENKRMEEHIEMLKYVINPDRKDN